MFQDFLFCQFQTYKMQDQREEDNNFNSFQKAEIDR